MLLKISCIHHGSELHKSKSLYNGDYTSNFDNFKYPEGDGYMYLLVFLQFLFDSMHYGSSDCPQAHYTDSLATTIQRGH